MASKGEIDRFETVQVDFGVVLQIIKHCHEEGSSLDTVNGQLAGLVNNSTRTLEVTNCFPLYVPETENPEEAAAEVNLDIMKKYRTLNYDYHNVGWYQSTHLGSHVDKNFLENQLSYQSALEESIVLVYDPLATSRGMLSIKAYRLSERLLECLTGEVEFTPENVQQVSVEHDDMFEEIPLKIKTSKLGSVLLCELEGRSDGVQTFDFLSLATSNVLQWNLKLLMSGVDMLHMDTFRLVQYEKKQGQIRQEKQKFLQKRREENQKRAAKGEPPLPESGEALEKEWSALIRTPVPPNRLDSMLILDQLDNYCQQLEKTASQGLGKMYLAEAMHQSSTS
jgi:translation initiation factor 3 subunit H